MSTGDPPNVTFLDALHEGIQVVDREFRYRYVNRAAAIHGKVAPNDLIGRTMGECYPGIEATASFAAIVACMRDREASSMLSEFAFADGSTGFFELRIEAVPEGVCVLSIDVTERIVAERRTRELEHRQRLGERLESIGRLSAGLAHDFNNLLGVVLGRAELALARPSGPTRSDVEVLADVARRSSRLTRDLLAFGRRQAMPDARIDPRPVVTGLATILSATIGSDVVLRVDAEEDVGLVDLSAAQLEQMMLNLVLNARDALPRGGTIRISLGSVDFDEETAARHGGSRTGPHVVLVVEDDGTGMDEATRARIFEPFFTTKPEGVGTGLGLPSVYGLVRQTGGTIWVYSEVGEGTTFKVYLPRSHATDELAPSRSGSSGPPTFEPSQARAFDPSRFLVLVVEDHDALRALSVETLSAHGFRVIAAADGMDALRTIVTDAGIDLVVTDAIMPGLRGPELVERARAVRPDLRFVCTSGCALESLERRFGSADGVSFLEKPFLPSRLVALVRELLADDGRKGDTARTA